MRAGIIQSNYIPWKGYFDFIDTVDHFVIFDDVQYTRRDWRNRNRIKSIAGPRWLTIPVEVKGKYYQRIDETAVADGAWVDDHMRSLQHTYASAPFFRTEWPAIAEIYESVREERLLTRVNERFIKGLCKRLAIETPISRSTDYGSADGKNERLIGLCKEAGADRYLSGPAAKGYIDESLWARNGITVEYKSYAGYKEYDQLYPPFEHGVTILDVLFHTGPNAREYIKSTKEIE